MNKPAELLITNAHIFTADNRKPFAEALAVSGNRIVFAGSRSEAAAWKGPGTKVMDGGGKSLVPGFIDSHFHMLFGALNLDGMQLSGVETFEELAQSVRHYAAEHPEDAWLVGNGLRYNLGPGRTPLNRTYLDALVPDRPIFISAYDVHTSWANTLALKMAGIFEGGEVGANSQIMLDEHGEATGELRETGASKPVSDLLPKPDGSRKRDLLQKALRLTASLGVTSVHNMDGGAETAQLYAALEDLDQLTCRIYLPFSVTPETPFEALEKEALLFKHEYASDRLRGGSVKFFMDGVIESYTGLLVDPYSDDPATHGAANYAIEHYQRMVTEADRLGLQIFTHAVGDLGVRRVLDACQAAAEINGRRDSRHRVEHIELVHPADLARFKELGVLASMQPLHCPMTLEDGDVWPARVGTERWQYSFAWRTLRDAGARLVFGSDWPVVTQNPLRGLSNAVNRLPWVEGLPHQNQTLGETLLAYTSEAAYGEFQEEQKGQLKPGYLADMVLLSENIFEIPPEKLAEVHPLWTMMDGTLVYES